MGMLIMSTSHRYYRRKSSFSKRYFVQYQLHSNCSKKCYLEIKIDCSNIKTHPKAPADSTLTRNLTIDKVESKK